MAQQDILSTDTLPQGRTKLNANSAEVQTHIDNTSNPHAVTAAQVGAIERGVHEYDPPISSLQWPGYLYLTDDDSGKIFISRGFGDGIRIRTDADETSSGKGSPYPTGWHVILLPNAEPLPGGGGLLGVLPDLGVTVHGWNNLNGETYEGVAGLLHKDGPDTWSFFSFGPRPALDSEITDGISSSFRSYTPENIKAFVDAHAGSVLHDDRYYTETEIDGMLPSGNVVGTSDTQTLTNKTLDFNNNTFLNLPSGGSTTTTITANAGVTVANGDWVYLDSSGDLQKTDASAESTSGPVLVGVVTDDTDQAAVVVTITGDWTTNGLTVGAPYYLSETVGQITDTAPTNDDAVVRVVGHAVSATRLQLSNDSTWVVLGAEPVGDVVGTTDTQTLTNKTVDLGSNTIQGFPVELKIIVSQSGTDLATGTGKATFRASYSFTLTDVRASVSTAPVGSSIEVDINEGGTSVLSTILSIDAGEKTSETAATAAVISDSAIAADAEISIDVDQVGSSTAGEELVVTLIGTRNL